MKKPADDRNWDEVDGIVEKMLDNKNLTDLQKARLRIEIYLVKDDLDEAKALANRLVKENPKDVAAWMSWLSVGERVAGEKFSKEAQNIKEVKDRKEVFERGGSCGARSAGIRREIGWRSGRIPRGAGQHHVPDRGR